MDKLNSMVVKIIGKAAEYLKKQHNRTDVPITKIVEKIILNAIRKPGKNGTGELFKKSLNLYPTFEDFMNHYDKKRGDRKKLEKKWNSFRQEIKEAIMLYVTDYKQAQPDKKYRKDPSTFFNNRSWEDELIYDNKSGRLTEEQQEYLANRNDI